MGSLALTLRKQNHTQRRKSSLKKQSPVLSFRFYIESISFLKDKNTVELFFLNAKACVHKVRQLFVFAEYFPSDFNTVSSAFLHPN